MHKADNLPPSCAVGTKSGSLNFLEPSGPVQACNGSVLPFVMLNRFRMLIHPSSGACDLFVELFRGLYCSGTMHVGVTLWFGWGGVVWYPDAY